jgi:hypothetical protein
VEYTGGFLDTSLVVALDLSIFFSLWIGGLCLLFYYIFVTSRSRRPGRVALSIGLIGLVGVAAVAAALSIKAFVTGEAINIRPGGPIRRAKDPLLFWMATISWLGFSIAILAGPTLDLLRKFRTSDNAASSDVRRR